MIKKGIDLSQMKVWTIRFRLDFYIRVYMGTGDYNQITKGTGGINEKDL